MFRQIIILSILYLLSSVQYSKAANEDYILSIINKDKFGGYIEREKGSTKGNGISVCSWIKQEADDLNFFEARDSENSEVHLRGYTSVKDNYIVAITGNYNKEYYVVIQDCNMKNITSWFHVCIIKNQTSTSFYLNGFPSNNYVQNANTSTMKSDDLSIKIGDIVNQGGNSSLYQINAFDRVLTAKDAKDMYKCKFMKGDMFSWTEITSKFKDIKFGDSTQLIQAPVPCPTPPPYNPIDCSTGEPLEDPSNNAAGDTGSASEDFGTSSQPGGSGSSSPSLDFGSSSPSEDSGSSSPSLDFGSSSPSEDSGSSSPSGDSGSSSPSGDSGSNSPNAGPVPNTIQDQAQKIQK